MVGTDEGYVVGLVGLVVVFCGFSCVAKKGEERAKYDAAWRTWAGIFF